MSASLASYVTAVALLLTHELDAILRHEWRLLFVLRNLEDNIAAQIFLWSHVPLIAALLWFSFVNGGSNQFRFGFSVFCILHVVMHTLIERNPACEFRNFSSRMLIWGTGISGALYLGLQF